jgi:N-acetylglucosaminyldiphosphoundecaprenol N-acetyl-beta-D-mannosaminyltransferase
MDRKKIISLLVNTGGYDTFLSNVISLGRDRRSSYVCVANVHMSIEAHDDPEFARIVNDADLVTPDGMPLIFALRLLYGLRQERVAGMDLIEDIIRKAEKENLSIFFYGSEAEVLHKIEKKTERVFPSLKIAGMYSPPFRELTETERQHEINMINESGANIVLVALGCPKQERWMANNRGNIRSVMVGLGAAFLVYAEVRNVAPTWMRKISLEWLYRLGQEPGRLWKRYLYTNTKFIGLLIKESISGHA